MKRFLHTLNHFQAKNQPKLERVNTVLLEILDYGIFRKIEVGVNKNVLILGSSLKNHAAITWKLSHLKTVL